MNEEHAAEVDRFLDQLDKADRITALDLTFDIARMRANGGTMTTDEFTEERFDAAYKSMLVKSNAETITTHLSDLFFKDHRLEGSMTMTVTEDGIEFEGAEPWLTQVYALLRPEQADEAAEAAASHLASEEKRPGIIRVIKSMFWRSTARVFVEEAEAD